MCASVSSSSSAPLLDLNIGQLPAWFPTSHPPWQDFADQEFDSGKGLAQGNTAKGRQSRGCAWVQPVAWGLWHLCPSNWASGTDSIGIFFFIAIH